MMKFLYAILTSSDLNKCRRAVSTIPDTAGALVVVNTTDPDYLSSVVRSDMRQRATIIDTPSNGTPGKGKQSVVDYFLSTDYDYLIPLDGDDFLCANGGKKLEDYVREHEPDVVGLMNEDIIVDEHIFSSWRELKLKDLLAPLNLSNFNEVRRYFHDVCSPIKQEGCLFNRLVCISKKAAKKIEWDQELPGSEDALLSAQLKLLHTQNVLDYHLIESQDVYVYCKQSVSGTGFKLFTSDVGWCREHYFSKFSQQDLDRLKSSTLPYTKFTSPRSPTLRFEDAKKVIKNFS